MLVADGDEPMADNHAGRRNPIERRPKCLVKSERHRIAILCSGAVEGK
jgi:hypothetical protein